MGNGGKNSIMKCPKCGKEMEKGIWVLGRGFENPIGLNIGLLWCKSYGLFKVKDKVDVMWQHKMEAYICKECRITLAEYPET